MCSVNKSLVIFGGIHGFLIVFLRRSFSPFSARKDRQPLPRALSTVLASRPRGQTASASTSSGNGARGRARDLGRHLLGRRRPGNALRLPRHPGERVLHGGLRREAVGRNGDWEGGREGDALRLDRQEGKREGLVGTLPFLFRACALGTYTK